jgi:hypothetical protein
MAVIDSPLQIGVVGGHFMKKLMKVFEPGTGIKGG